VSAPLSTVSCYLFFVLVNSFDSYRLRKGVQVTGKGPATENKGRATKWLSGLEERVKVHSRKHLKSRDQQIGGGGKQETVLDIVRDLLNLTAAWEDRPAF
jgi:hypothetical protein